MNHLYLRTHVPGEWVVTKQYNWKHISVPIGFVTDLASIPWIVSFLFLSDDTRKAAVVHDWLYCDNTYLREECDDLFYEALLESGVSKLHAYAMWLGVRLGGWKYYNKRAKGEGLTREDILSFDDVWRENG